VTVSLRLAWVAALGWLAGRPLRMNSDRDHGVLVLDEIAQVAVFLVADRGLEADRLLGDLSPIGA